MDTSEKNILVKIPFKNLRLKKHITHSLKLLLPQVSIQIYTVLDKTMIGIITQSEPENGYYEQAQKICRAMLTLTTAPGLVIIPKVSYLWGNNMKNKISPLIKRNFLLLFAMSCPIISGVFVLADRFVPIYFGNGYECVAVLMRVLVLLTFVAGVSSILGSQYLIPTQRENIYSCAVLISACFNVVLNLFLIEKYAAIGAAIASITSEIIGMLYRVIYLRKEIDYKSLFRPFRKYLFLSFIMGIMLTMLEKIISHNGLKEFMLMTTIGCCIYIVGLYITRDPILQKDFGIRSNASCYESICNNTTILWYEICQKFNKNVAM